MITLQNKFVPQKLPGYCEKFWFTYKGKTFLFKKPLPESRSDIGEVFASYLYNKLGIEKYINYALAQTCDGVQGTICEKYEPDNLSKVIDASSIIQTNYIIKHCFDKELNTDSIPITTTYINDLIEKEYNPAPHAQYDYSIEKIIREIQIFCFQHQININENKLFDNLCNIFILDYFTAQTDRNPQNILFEIKKDKNQKSYLDVFPLIDNGSVFGLDMSEETIKAIKGKNEAVYQKFGLSEVGSLSEGLNQSKLFFNGGILAHDILELKNKNPACKKIFDAFMTMDFPKVIESFEKENNIEIPEIYKNFMEATYNTRIAKIYQFEKKLHSKLKNKDVDLGKWSI